jgi:hypothetical protein
MIDFAIMNRNYGFISKIMKKIGFKFLIFVSIMALSLASIPFSPISPVQNTYADATKCDQDFFSKNDILFYNPCATTCGDVPAGPAGAITKLRGSGNGEKIFNFWLDSGLTSQQAAGITGSMQSEAGFSAFRQESSKQWPNGGWGIAQFTASQRVDATASVQASAGADVFNQYYKPDYGGPVLESNGFVPTGVPVDVNDKFLLGELNYLLSYTKTFVPFSVRTSGLKADFGQSVPTNTPLYDYLKSVVLTGDVAAAWTYLYEQPANIKATTLARQNNAAKILTLHDTASGISTTCGGSLSAGGMTLAEGIQFMNDYKNTPSNVQYIAGAGQDCPGGPLSNCVSFSVFFVRKFTNLKESGAAGNGSTVVAHLLSLNPTAKSGHSPQPYAIFSTPSGSQMCGNVKCGHTGVILGVDTARGVVVVGEAACGAGRDWDTAREYPLSRFDSDAYTYIYTDGLLKGAVK